MGSEIRKLSHLKSGQKGTKATAIAKLFEICPSKSFDFKFCQLSDPHFLLNLSLTFLLNQIGPSLVPTLVVIESLTYWPGTLQKSSIENTKLIPGRQKEVIKIF